MTQVRIDIRKPSITGVNVPLIIGMVWSPSTQRVVNDALVVPESFSVTLGQTPTIIEVAPTQPDWVWRVRYTANSEKFDRYLVVPNSATVVDFTDLVEVDPGTLSPQIEPEAAWWASVQYMLRGVILAPSDPVPAGLPPGSLVFRTQ